MSRHPWRRGRKERKRSGTGVEESVSFFLLCSFARPGGGEEAAEDYSDENGAGEQWPPIVRQRLAEAIRKIDRGVDGEQGDRRCDQHPPAQFEAFRFFLSHYFPLLLVVELIWDTEDLGAHHPRFDQLQ